MSHVTEETFYTIVIFERAVKPANVDEWSQVT